jgi:3-carboxy-cis,cis-muconate cycloisomerase
LFDRLFSSDSINAIFSDSGRLQGMLYFESALARAQADCGMIPLSAAEAIVPRCRAELFDRDLLSRAAERSGNLAIPLVKELTRLVRESSGEAAGYVHWGATSQDTIDTGMVLQIGNALQLVELQMDRLCDRLALLSEQHRHTPMAGRTWLQHAVPITFGLKMAGALDSLLRHQERLDQLKERALVLQFGGAAGTLASLEGQGLDVAPVLAKKLGLQLPSVPWHGHRDRVAEVATFHGLLMGTLGKIARDLSLLMQTEVAEVAEAAEPGRGGSSTMPHKRNSVATAAILSSALRVPGLVATMLSAMVQEHERGLGGWHAEWEVLPEICSFTFGALEKLRAVFENLQVNPGAMMINLERTRGLLLAEAISMALAKQIGLDQSHALLESASHRALNRGLHLREVIEHDDQLMQYFDREQLHLLFDPAMYTGEAQKMIDAVLRGYHARKQTRVQKGV